MSRIKIKNFGPIKEGYQENDGWMDVKKVTVFIGNQGSGKSVVAKLISTFLWIEKALTRGDYTIKHFQRKNKLRKSYLSYHRIENYVANTNSKKRTIIEFQGDSYHFRYENANLFIENVESKNYLLPQIMYVPAERNFISNVKTPKALNLTSDSLIEFVTEFDNAKNEIKGAMELPINGVDIEYDKLNDIVNIKGGDYKIRLTEASSGFQSLVPLYLVSWFLTNSVRQKSENTKDQMTSEQQERFRKRMQEINKLTGLTDVQKRIAISEEAKKFNKTAFINVVEEPEQNLFPSSQKKMLESLLEFNNTSKGNKLIMTTHSLYLINYLTLAVKANTLKEKVKTDDMLKNKLKEIVPLESTVSSDNLVIYELDDKGNIVKLRDYKGLPSDENYLNQRIAESNELFAQLLEIQQAL